MQFMGASIALAGLGLDRLPPSRTQHAVPYSKGVEWQIPGNALHYATVACRAGVVRCRLSRRAYNGRPTKLEGNPNVPGFNGSTDRFRPERGARSLRSGPLEGRAECAIRAAPIILRADAGTISGKRSQRLRTTYLASGGEGLAILDRAGHVSPTRERLRGEVQKVYPKLTLGRVRAVGGQSEPLL